MTAYRTPAERPLSELARAHAALDRECVDLRRRRDCYRDAPCLEPLDEAYCGALAAAERERDALWAEIWRRAFTPKGATP